MLRNYEYNFRLKTGKYVFVQRDDAEQRGNTYISKITNKYKPANYFFHFKSTGGHVNAMRVHHGNEYFSHYDLTKFFPSITRSKISRSLRKIGMSSDHSFDIAADSVVHFNNKRFLPYGFVQSNIIATLVLEMSALGRFISKIDKLEATSSIYVDDIIISSNDLDTLKGIDIHLRESALIAGFEISKEKTQVCQRSIKSFNCLISKNLIEITSDRMNDFKEDFGKGGIYTKLAIKNYVNSINPVQAALLTK